MSEGRVLEAEIPWAGGAAKVQKQRGGPILLGVLKLKEGQLVAEVNSTNRAKQIGALVVDRLGKNARYKTTLIEPLEGTIDKLWEQAMNQPGALERVRRAAAGANEPAPLNDPVGVDDAVDPNSAEIQAVMKQIVMRHWDTWFDIPIPDLNDLTPREAATTSEGRDLLESLFNYYASQNERAVDDLLNPDLPSLRRELDMEE
jgi:hypothetical protein